MLHLITTRKINIISTALVCGLLLMGAAFQYGGIKHDLVNVVTSASSLVLTNTSTQVQRLTGSTAQTVKLPNATTSRVGWWHIVSNDSTQTATVTNGNDEPIGTITAGNSATFYLTSTSTLGGPWDLQPGNGGSGSSSSSAVYWSGYHDTGCNWTSTVTGGSGTSIYGSDLSGCGFTEESNKTSGFPTVSTYTTGVGEIQPGITFTANATMAPSANTLYEVCVYGSSYKTTNAGYSGIYLNDGSSVYASAIIGQGSGTGNMYPFTICGWISVTSGNSYTWYLGSNNSTNGNQIGNVSGASLEHRALYWKMKKIN